MNKTKRIIPKAGQESVWDYPRPPKVEPFSGNIRIEFAGDTIINTNRALRLLETSHPPTFYLPLDDFKDGVLKPAEKLSFCEFKGAASYFHIENKGQFSQNAAWYYPEPNKNFSMLKNTVSVYAHLVDACFINDEKVQAQEGDFYGGWIYSKIVGPFKGAPGTWGW